MVTVATRCPGCPWCDGGVCHLCHGSGVHPWRVMPAACGWCEGSGVCDLLAPSAGGCAGDVRPEDLGDAAVSGDGDDLSGGAVKAEADLGEAGREGVEREAVVAVDECVRFVAGESDQGRCELPGAPVGVHAVKRGMARDRGAR
jgi:hypothetical protein